MEYCRVCGTLLEMRHHPTEGRDVPYCTHCQEYRFPMYNVAVSMVVQNEDGQILLIQQYGRPRYILVAGYVNQGEAAEDAVRRELMEETGLQVKSCHFNKSKYFPPSNTLMLNFAVTVAGELHPNEEIDAYQWFSKEESKKAIYEGSLAEEFLLHYLGGHTE